MLEIWSVLGSQEEFVMFLQGLTSFWQTATLFNGTPFVTRIILMAAFLMVIGVLVFWVWLQGQRKM